MTDAIASEYGTGTPWMALPAHFGSAKGADRRQRKRTADGTRVKDLTALPAQAGADCELGRVVTAGSTVVHAHRHAAAKARRRSSGRRTR
ncbi:hypothetical protein [Streptomyces sp. NPDC002463]|uniref:hypothetical protein n=1 Tax=Streptomyces sp. NPDC002463 TaxID=3364645 RepID=UPI003682D5BA